MNEELASEWVARAEEDCEAMRVLFAGETEALGNVVGFLAQQLVEKYLKGLLIFRGLAPPRTHSLGALLDALARTDADLSSWREDVEMLSPFAVEFRYPGGRARPEQVREGVEIALRFRGVARRILGLANDSGQ